LPGTIARRFIHGSRVFARSSGRPFAGVWFAFGETWFVGVKAPFDKASGGQAPQLNIVEFGDWDVQPANLREGKFALVEGVANTAALPKQPILV
jgi:hypothetical protein